MHSTLLSLTLTVEHNFWVSLGWSANIEIYFWSFLGKVTPDSLSMVVRDYLKNSPDFFKAMRTT